MREQRLYDETANFEYFSNQSADCVTATAITTSFAFGHASENLLSPT